MEDTLFSEDDMLNMPMLFMGTNNLETEEDAHNSQKAQIPIENNILLQIEQQI